MKLSIEEKLSRSFLNRLLRSKASNLEAAVIELMSTRFLTGKAKIAILAKALLKVRGV